MNILQHWLESLHYDYKILPSCTHYQSPRSSCRKCIDNCPEQAITFMDGKPFIDAEKCTQCSKCVVACPVHAVEGILPKRTVINNQLIISGEESISLKELLVYYKKSVITIVFEHEDSSDEWKQIIKNTNEVLSELGEATFNIKYGKVAEETGTMMTRKELFFSWKKEVKNIAKELVPAKLRFNQESLDLTKRYPNHQFIDFTLDTGTCTLCKACEILCPKACIQITDTHFTVAPVQCSNCSLCEDICPEQAISITSKISPVTPINYLFQESGCSSCEENFNTLDEGNQMCYACRKKKQFSLM
ncbi:4Fe-4S dicluster domain-containing protein [Sporosarcina sp. FA9]|uniref:4Fe-4S dicluster domain-containing protein n=1 Tax=Sporosarcina sp. FA9 TaxID=3413030 RepID=UPI003F655601